jgi:CHAT domain-containing protein/tetratricopeptide (TPR) repeat protein
LTRPLDKHLDSDELDRLVTLPGTSVSGSERLSEHALGEAQRHVESCQDCSRKLQMHKSVQSEILRMRAPNPSPPTPECVGDAEWLEVAAGLLPDAKTRELMKHAAQCGHCGPLLKKAAETLADETTPNEEIFLNSLSSARPAWRKNMAATLRDSVGAQGGNREKDGARWWQALLSWPRPAFALAGLAVAVIAGWAGLRMLHPPSVEQLLAQAYTEHRTLEVRIPGAKYAPMRVERAVAGSSLDKSPSLLKAEALIGENLRKNPNDSAWLQARARADLLDGNYDSAIKSLQRALETQPDAPSLLTDLGSAYFVRAEAADRPIDYGNAIESLSKALAKSPDDPVALFNRALASERMFIYTQAVDDWEHYLRVDTSGEWAEDARKRLADVKQKVEQHEKGQAEPLLSPAEIARGARDPGLRAKLDERIEEYLHVAVVEWLPKGYPADGEDLGQAGDYQTALRVVAELTEQKHGDRWLTDVLLGTSSEDFESAVVILARSIASMEKGDYLTAQELAFEAEQAFRSGNNLAGVLRARYERVYSMHAAQKGSPCLRVAAQFHKDMDDVPYRWLRIQLHLDEGTCEWLVGDLGRTRQYYYLALKDAETSNYAALYLRAINHSAGIDSALGNELSSWAQAQSGLALYWSAKVPPMQGYNLYFALHEVADWTHQPHLDVAVWQQAVAIADDTPNPILRGAAHSYLGNAAITADMPELAERELRKAADLFAAAPRDQPARIARVEAETRLANFEALQGNASRAYERLTVLQSEVSGIPDNLLALIFYRAMGEAQFQRGSLREADSALRSAVTLAELNLKSLHGEDTRERWSDESRAAYRDLTQLRLRQGDSQGALEIWEWYRGLALRSTQHTFLSALPSPAQLAGGPALPRLDRVASWLPTLTNESVLSYAVFNDGVEIWAYDSRGISSQWVAIPIKQLRRLASRFRSLCSDPSSDIRYLHDDARALYDLLVAPVEPAISLARALVIEADDALSGVPFEALLDRSGHYVVERVPVVSSFGLYYTEALRQDGILSTDSLALIEAVPAPVRAAGEIVSPLPDVEAEAKTIAAMFQLPALLIGGEATSRETLVRLPAASIFHFAGHAAASTKSAGLLVSDGLIGDREVRSLQLSKLQLVVLSACETERGTGESPIDPDSLVRSFMRSRVPHVVASRWQVDSAAARMFMTSFYAELLSGETVSRSIQVSELTLKSRPGMDHPYYWSAFHGFGRS